MNHTHPPRSLITLLFILVAVTFFVATLRTFAPAHAAPILESLAKKADVSTPTSTSSSDIPNPGPTPTPPPPSLLPPPTVEETFIPTLTPTFTPIPTAIPIPASADTTGIIALAILMVVVMLLGMAWGGRSLRKK